MQRPSPLQMLVEPLEALAAAVIRVDGNRERCERMLQQLIVIATKLLLDVYIAPLQPTTTMTTTATSTAVNTYNALVLDAEVRLRKHYDHRWVCRKALYLRLRTHVNALQQATSALLLSLDLPRVDTAADVRHAIDTLSHLIESQLLRAAVPTSNATAGIDALRGLLHLLELSEARAPVVGTKRRRSADAEQSLPTTTSKKHAAAGAFGPMPREQCDAAMTEAMNVSLQRNDSDTQAVQQQQQQQLMASTAVTDSDIAVDCSSQLATAAPPPVVVAIPAAAAPKRSLATSAALPIPVFFRSTVIGRPAYV